MDYYFTGIEYLLYSKNQSSAVMAEFKKIWMSWDLLRKVEKIPQKIIQKHSSTRMRRCWNFIQSNNTKIESEGCVYIYAGTDKIIHSIWDYEFQKNGFPSMCGFREKLLIYADSPWWYWKW